jgi:hypothetical protein
VEKRRLENNGLITWKPISQNSNELSIQIIKEELLDGLVRQLIEYECEEGIKGTRLYKLNPCY